MLDLVDDLVDDLLDLELDRERVGVLNRMVAPDPSERVGFVW